MKKILLLVGIGIALAGWAVAQDEYPLGPDSERQAGVPQGKVTQYTWNSKIFPGTTRNYWVYVPAQYTADKPACVMFFEDGKGYVSETGRIRIPIVFDNLIAKHDMPVTIAVLIDPGVAKAAVEGAADRPNRSFEYDAMSDLYSRFLIEEMLPEVSKNYNISKDPSAHAISGGSSGGICSFTVAWLHPEAFRRVLSFIGSFTDLRGGDIYPFLIRKVEPKPLRVFLQDGDHDLNNPFGSWWLANQSMAMALKYSGYEVNFVTGTKDHDYIQAGAVLPDALRWLWHDYPQPITQGKLRPLGSAQSGLIDIAPEWEAVSSDTDIPPALKNSAHAGAGLGATVDASGTVYACERNGIMSYDASGKKSVRAHGVSCHDIAAAPKGGLYFSDAASGGLEYLPAGSNHPQRVGAADGKGRFKATGITLSHDGGMLYAGDPASKWVWSYQVQTDGTLANGEAFFRLETADESSESGATGMTTDARGQLFVASALGIQICGSGGPVDQILARPEQAEASLGPVKAVAFGGADHDYLYAVVGSQIYRRHFVKR